jgi:hypothetical protein
MPWPLGEWSESGAATAAWCMWKDSNLHCAGFEAAASAVGHHMRIGAPGEIRTHTARVLSAMPPAVGLPARGAPYRLRSCVCALPKRCPAIERRERGARSIESNVHLSRYKPEALPVELCGRSGAGSLDRTDGLRITRAALCQLSYASMKKTNGRRSCFASPKSGSRTNAVQFLDAHDVKQHGHRWPISNAVTHSRAR